MTDQPRPRPRRASFTALAGLLLAGLLAAAAASAAMAQASPQPAQATAQAASPASPEPELTWAPLVTLPPIVPPSVTSPADLAHGYTLGDPDAPVSVEVWEDFQCPYCRIFAVQVKPYLVDTYVVPGKVSLTFRDLAFLGDESQWAAVAADLAAEQDRFWPFHDYLFANQLGENVGSFGLDRLLAIGEAVGLDMPRFKAGLVLDAARERFARIDAASQQEAAGLGITGTPSIVLDGKHVQFSSFDDVFAAIDAAVAAAEGTAEPSSGSSSPAPAVVGSPGPPAAAPEASPGA
jgi:protein-disulfide isomerase